MKALPRIQPSGVSVSWRLKAVDSSGRSGGRGGEAGGVPAPELCCPQWSFPWSWVDALGCLPDFWGPEEQRLLVLCGPAQTTSQNHPSTRSIPWFLAHSEAQLGSAGAVARSQTSPLDTCSGFCLCPREFLSRIPLPGGPGNYSAGAHTHMPLTYTCIHSSSHMHACSHTSTRLTHTHIHLHTHIYTRAYTHTRMLTPPCTHKCMPSRAYRRRAVRWRRTAFGVTRSEVSLLTLGQQRSQAPWDQHQHHRVECVADQPRRSSCRYSWV